jgi:hypothetical protein
MGDIDWPFDQAKNCAVVTLRSIVFDGEPILYVSHDADDHGWQFLDGNSVEMANAALVSLATIVALDRSVLEVAHMPPGWFAVRTSKTSPWECAPAEGEPPVTTNI